MVKCPVCESHVNSEIGGNRTDILLRKCSCCHLVFDSGNSAVLYENNEASTLDYYFLSAKTDKKNFIDTLKKIEKFTAQSSILDVGCNIGTFLEAAIERGWKSCVGVEPNLLAAQHAGRKGLKVIEGYFNEKCVNDLSNQVIDVIHMGDVIEHVSKPLTLLEGAHRSLKPLGYLIIVTPDFDNYFAKKYQIKPKEHLVYFNRFSLIYALNKSGFEVVSIKKQFRRRNLLSIPDSTTRVGWVGKIAVKLAQLPILLNIFEMISGLFGDELLVIAKKNN